MNNKKFDQFKYNSNNFSAQATQSCSNSDNKSDFFNTAETCSWKINSGDKERFLSDLDRNIAELKKQAKIELDQIQKEYNHSCSVVEEKYDADLAYLQNLHKKEIDRTKQQLSYFNDEIEYNGNLIQDFPITNKYLLSSSKFSNVTNNNQNNNHHSISNIINNKNQTNDPNFHTEQQNQHMLQFTPSLQLDSNMQLPFEKILQMFGTSNSSNSFGTRTRRRTNELHTSKTKPTSTSSALRINFSHNRLNLNLKNFQPKSLYNSLNRNDIFDDYIKIIHKNSKHKPSKPKNSNLNPNEEHTHKKFKSKTNQKFLDLKTQKIKTKKPKFKLKLKRKYIRRNLKSNGKANLHLKNFETFSKSKLKPNSKPKSLNSNSNSNSNYFTRSNSKNQNLKYYINGNKLNANGIQLNIGDLVLWTFNGNFENFSEVFGSENERKNGFEERKTCVNAFIYAIERDYVDLLFRKKVKETEKEQIFRLHLNALNSSICSLESWSGKVRNGNGTGNFVPMLATKQKPKLKLKPKEKPKLVDLSVTEMNCEKNNSGDGNKNNGFYAGNRNQISNAVGLMQIFPPPPPKTASAK